MSDRMTAEETTRSGVAVLRLADWDVGDLNAFVDTVTHLVQDHDNVRHVEVRVQGEPPRVLAHLVGFLDRQARIFDKTVALSS
jgi:hypothetical protein